MQRVLLAYVPDEVTEAEHQNTHSGELDDTSEVGIERFYEISKHGCERQRTEALGEGHRRGHRHSCKLPFPAPVLDGSQQQIS